MMTASGNKITRKDIISNMVIKKNLKMIESTYILVIRKENIVPIDLIYYLKLKIWIKIAILFWVMKSYTEKKILRNITKKKR